MVDVIRFEIEEKDLSIPIDKKVLGKFISGLLGQPQTFERKIET
jgi:hypothetical protein